MNACEASVRNPGANEVGPWVLKEEEEEEEEEDRWRRAPANSAEGAKGERLRSER
jgi:hypothetical protein